jgi:5-formyltetrahydrofolate cyclo-ligase
MAFWSFGSEVDTGELLRRLRAAGLRVALPRIRDGEVEPAGFEPGGALAPTSFGAMEPASTAAVDPERIDVVLTPGVAFDRRGNRVGYGRGYYDRLLARIRAEAATIAIAFDLQVVDQVPAGRGDRRVDVIVTESEVIRCSDA